MDRDVNFRSQGPEVKSEEHLNRETSRQIAFCSIFIVCLFGLPSVVKVEKFSYRYCAGSPQQ